MQRCRAMLWTEKKPGRGQPQARPGPTRGGGRWRPLPPQGPGRILSPMCFSKRHDICCRHALTSLAHHLPSPNTEFRVRPGADGSRAPPPGRVVPIAPPAPGAQHPPRPAPLPGRLVTLHPPCARTGRPRPHGGASACCARTCAEPGEQKEPRGPWPPSPGTTCSTGCGAERHRRHLAPAKELIFARRCSQKSVKEIAPPLMAFLPSLGTKYKSFGTLKGLLGLWFYDASCSVFSVSFPEFTRILAASFFSPLVY